MNLFLAVAALVARLVDPDVAIHSGTVFSMNNDNSRFEVMLRTDSLHDRFPTLRVGDRAFPTTGSSRDA